MVLIRQKRPGGYVRIAGIVAFVCLSLPAFGAKAGGGSSDPYSYAELLLDDLRSVPEYELGPKQYLLVIGAFEKVAEEHPSHAKSDNGLLVRGVLYEELAERFKNPSHRDKAVESYQELTERFPDSPLREKALSSLQGLGIELAESAAGEGTAAEDAEAGREIPRPANFVRPERGPGPTALNQARFWTQQGYTRVVIELDDATDIRYDRLHKPERIYIDFMRSRLARNLRPNSTVEVGDGLLQRIRMGQNRRDVARVVFDLNLQAHFSTSWLSNPPRLVVELRRTAPELLAENAEPKRQSGEPPAAPEAPAKDRPKPRLVARADSLDLVFPEPRDSYVPAPVDSPVVAGKITPTAAASLSEPEPMEKAAGTIDPGRGPSVRTEEIPPPFGEAETASRAPEFERFEQATHQPAAPSRQAIRAAGPGPAIQATLTPSSGDLNGAQERLILAKLEPPPVAEPAPKIDLPPPKAAETTSRGDRNLIRALGLKVGRIVIDPGHGGHDTGTIGDGKLREKDLVNDLAQRLGKLIQERLGSEVIYTRKDDRFIPLRERTKLANDAEADLFISIHANSARQRSVRGIETFYLNLATDSWAMAVAARENAAAQRSVHELENLVAKITRNEHLSESREFASNVQASLYKDLSKQTKGLRNRGVRKAPLIVLIGAKMPAILTEISFLSNSQDEKLLKTSSYRNKVAEALYSGISAYADTLSSVTVTEKTATTAGMD